MTLTLTNGNILKGCFDENMTDGKRNMSAVHPYKFHRGPIKLKAYIIWKNSFAGEGAF